MFFWRRVAPQIPEEGLKPTATPGYTRNFRDLNNLVSRGKSFSGYERNSLFLNQNGEGFAEVAGLLNIDYDDDARAVASMDWDRDGDLDLWITNRSAPQVRLLRNNHPSSSSFVAIRLVGNGTTTNRDAIGARLTLTSSSDQTKQIRTLRAGDGFLAQSSDWTHFGLGAASATSDFELNVNWPGGDPQTFAGLKAGTRYTITQGESKPRVEGLAPLEIAQNERKTSASTADGPTRNGFWVANPVPFPALTFANEQSETQTTKDFLGKPVLVNVWATWCVPCMEELSMFAKHADSINNLGATVLALNVDELAVDGKEAAPAAKMAELLKRVGYSMPHGRARRENLAKIEVLIEYLSSRRAPLSIPSSFLVDAEGNVSAVYLEPVSWEQLSGDLAVLTRSPQEQLARATPRPGRWLADPRQAIDRAAYLADYSTHFAANGFPKESQRLFKIASRALGQSGEGQDARMLYNQAKSAAQQGLTKQAKEHYQNAIRLDPNYGQALTGLGALLLMEKNLEGAKELFEKALRIDPNHATALINLAMIDQARGDNENALKRLQRVVTMNPGYAQAHFNLGALLASQKRYEEAIEPLSKAAELNPKMLPAHMNLALVYSKTAGWREAEKHYRLAVRLNPRLEFAHYGLGTVLAKQEQHRQAVESFRQAITLAEQARTHTRLGQSLLALGEKRGAKAAFEQALRIDPEFSDAKLALQQIKTAAE